MEVKSYVCVYNLWLHLHLIKSRYWLRYANISFNNSMTGYNAKPPDFG